MNKGGECMGCNHEVQSEDYVRCARRMRLWHVRCDSEGDWQIAMPADATLGEVEVLAEKLWIELYGEEVDDKEFEPLVLSVEFAGEVWVPPLVEG